MTPLKECLEYEETEARNDDCVWYNTCLERAAQMRWKSFTCSNCSCYIGGHGLKIEDFIVRKDVTEPKPLGNMGNLRRITIGLGEKLRKKGIIMLGFREGQKKNLP